MTANIMLAIQGLILTVGALLIFVAIVHFGNIIFDQEKIHRSLHLHKPQKFFEFTIFKFSLYILLAYLVIAFLMQWWDVPKPILNGYRQIILNGTTFYGIRIIPMRLIIALMVYAIIQMAWKYALLYRSKTDKYDPAEKTQEVITSLLSYVVFAVAVLCGLLVSGVDFTGLAIVAGALSVGIGFGLQNIVNNFVSGVIILLEETIKPGDRVLIKGQEGFVKKISLRYTRIETLLKEDVIIPNSDLMSTPIINFEFDNKFAKIKCFVGVAYNSDFAFVKQVLLNVAAKHSEVLQDPLNKPVVYMNEFAENNIHFELSCMIADVNRKHNVTSDLNFLIVEAFRENNIAMSLPQREIYIRQDS